MNKQINGYLFDLDGVLWQGENLIPGVKETLEFLRSQDKKLMFVSNTSSRSRQGALNQFKERGIAIADDEVFLASEETAKYLAQIKPMSRACVLGSKGLFEELEKVQIFAYPPNAVAPEDFDFLVVGKDRKMTFESMTYALRVVQAGAALVAVNNDPIVPGNDGLEPGAGALVAMISSMIGRPADIQIGKPGTLLLELALQQSGLSADECVMIGDTLEADIVAGNNLGMKTILVLTGNAAKEDLTEKLPDSHKPDIVLDSVKDLLTGEL